MPSHSPRLRAVLQALLVTFLWATSWVLVKLGLQEIPSLTFAGLRYGLAALALLPFALRLAGRAELGRLPRAGWAQVAILGLLFYAITQGAQFVALSHLPAVTVNLLLNFSTIVVAGLGVVFLAERPTPLQWAGMLFALCGALVFFFPFAAAAGPAAGFAAAGTAVSANALSAVLGRRVNRAGAPSPLVLTAVSMSIGSLLLLGTGLALQGLPALTLAQWGVILWLALVNTALAFSLWNHTLRTLSALESSIINNLLILQIPLLAWLFLGEALTPLKIGGLTLVGVGTLLVQLRGLRRPRRVAPPQPAGGPPLEPD